MTPLLALTLTILTPTTPLATINPTPTTSTERTTTMAQAQGNPHTTSSPSHPIIRQGPPTTRARIGMDASNPTIPPQRHGNTITRNAPTTFTDTRTTH